MSTPAPFPDLYEYALKEARLSAERRELPIIAAGADVDYSWLTKFSHGKIPGASYQKVARVAAFYMARKQPPSGGATA
jgi:hypothetical protein